MNKEMNDFLIRGKVEGDQKDKKRLTSQNWQLEEEPLPLGMGKKRKKVEIITTQAGGVAPCC